jgi:hypothetical protein
MSTIATIINDAYRETNLIARGASENAVGQEEALRLLNRYIESLFGNEIGDNVQEMLFGQNSNIDPTTYNNEFQYFVENWYLPVGYRLKLNLDETKTIKLAPNPQDGDLFAIVDASHNLASYPLTIQGNGSHIQGATQFIANTNGYSAIWFYRADKANWKRVTDLLLTDESPFPKAFDDLLIIGLAMRLDPRNGLNLSDISMSRYANVLKKFRARYSPAKEKSVDWALARIDGNRRYRRGYSVEGEFERGTILPY